MADDGTLLGAWGDVESPVYARSAVKPLQALPLVETGAADHFGLGDAELALACASHSGEPVHVERILGWLLRIGLSPSDLECGAHPPRDREALADWIRAGSPESAVYNNCSGKHAGFLTTAVFLGEPTAGYVQADHPVQQRVRGVLGACCGFDLAAAPAGVDGCGIPVLGISLRRLALGMARFATGAGFAPDRAAAAERLRRAMSAEPAMVAGSGRFCTLAMRGAGAALLVKTGAEGVFTAALPGQGIGVALKIDDGAQRAAEAAVAGLLDAIGTLPETARDYLGGTAEAPLRNVAGREVGSVRCVSGWLDDIAGRSWSDSDR